MKIYSISYTMIHLKIWLDRCFVIFSWPVQLSCQQQNLPNSVWVLSIYSRRKLSHLLCMEACVFTRYLILTLQSCSGCFFPISNAANGNECQSGGRNHLNHAFKWQTSRRLEEPKPCILLSVTRKQKAYWCWLLRQPWSRPPAINNNREKNHTIVKEQCVCMLVFVQKHLYLRDTASFILFW